MSGSTILSPPRHGRRESGFASTIENLVDLSRSRLPSPTTTTLALTTNTNTQEEERGGLGLRKKQSVMETRAEEVESAPTSPSQIYHLLPSNRSAIPRFTTTLSTVSVLSLLSFAVVYFAYTGSQPFYPPGSLAPDARGQGAGSCRMSFMSPSYLRLDGFGREYTRLGAGPWGLYLYREAGWDPEPYAQQKDTTTPSLGLTGTPVVFVPGNAGSFRQVRSLASAASRAWWEVPGVRRKGAGPKEGGRNLDFFTLDYNDDFSAFHGQTMLDQAEYLADSIRFILSLYHQKDGASQPDPTSVIVVAHSMGGVVARAAFLHPHFQTHSISTLITFATPHVVPPVTVDRGVDGVYDAVNKYWRKGYGLEASTKDHTSKEREALSDLVLVSIGGGLSDVTIASESVSLASLVPHNDSHGFTVFTSSIPGVNTPIDHLAILWCQQLMQTVAQSILSIVDVRRSQNVIPREERVTKLQEKLLGGLESRVKEVEGREVGLASLERGSASKILKVGERLVISPSIIREERETHVLPIPPTRTYGSARVFSLLTSSTIGRGKDSAVEVYACSSASADADDVTLTEPLCTPLFPSHVSSLPLSPHGPVSPILPPPLEDGTMGFLTIEVSQLEGKESIVVVVKAGNAWVMAEFGDKTKRVHVVEKSPLQLLLGGFKIEAFPETPTMVSEIWIPALDSSLLTFKLQVFRSECQETTSLFAPMVRQYSPLLHESKLFPNVRQASLYTHASGPYQPPPMSPFAASGTRLQFFIDPTCARQGTSSDLAVEITLDVWATIGALVMRYRMAAVSVPFSLVMLVMNRQLRDYNAGKSFPAFGSALSYFSRHTFIPLLAFLTGLSFLQSIALGTHLSSAESLYAAEPGHIHHSSLPPTWVSDALLGNRGTFFAFLPAFVVFTCFGAVVVEYFALQALISGAAWLVRAVHMRGSTLMKNLVHIAEPRETLPAQRVLTMSALLLVVLFFAPYQFAFLVVFLVHFFSTVRSLVLAQDVSSPSTPASTKRLWDRYHYSFSVLFVMLTLLPITALILVVWVRNLAVGWLAPFSSDHNVLNVLGFLLSVEALHSGKMLTRTTGSKITSYVANVLPWIAGGYGLIYGMRFTHNVYPLANAWFLYLAANNSDALVGAVHEAVIGKRRMSKPPSRRVATSTATSTPIKRAHSLR